jgi:predicted RNA-binding Zn ribbon-like protein
VRFTPAENPPAKRAVATVASALAALIAEEGFDRLGVCSAGDCFDVFVDTSRNRSRRYCNQICSTKMNVAAYPAPERRKKR